ncbi:LamG-like jellyroll fold domain-containing protein, partial [Nanoarchaeota archaeon]
MRPKKNKVRKTNQRRREVHDKRDTYFTYATLLIVLTMVMVSAYFIGKQLGMTGFGVTGPEESHAKDIFLNLDSNEMYTLDISNHEGTFELKNLRLDGEIIGEGEVRAYLVGPDGNDYLILDNEAIGSSTNMITGQATTGQEEATDPEKEISLTLAYQSGTRWDADDDGTAATHADAVDLTIDSTIFNWDVDESKLCTGWTIIPDQGPSTTLCNGATDCCSMFGVSPSDDVWNMPLYLYYGQHGSTADNIVEAQVMYLNQNLEPGKITFESAQSSVSSLPVRFRDDTSEQFSGVCVNTCELPEGFDSTEYDLRFEVEEGTELRIERIRYTIVYVQDEEELREKKAPKAKNFRGKTTKFNAVADFEHVDNPVIEKPDKGKIKWRMKDRNISGADFDRHVKFGKKWVSVDSSSLNSDLNSSAEITLYDLPYQYMPDVYSDGTLCEECERISYEEGDFTFIVPHFTNFSIGSNSNLTIWDQNDSNMPFADWYANVSEQINFYANYSNSTGDLIASADCNISFPDMPDIPMPYNSTFDLFAFDRTFDTPETLVWTVNCDNDSYEPLLTTDNITIVGQQPSCGTEITSDIVLNNDLQHSGTGACLNMTADNIVLDCNGYNINGSNTPDSQGIYAEHRFNVTIKNCNITNFPEDIIIFDTDNSTVENNSIVSGNGYCSICVSGGSKDIDVRQNNITGSNQRKLHAENSNDIIFSNNNVTGGFSVDNSEGVLFRDQVMNGPYNFTNAGLAFEKSGIAILRYQENITHDGGGIESFIRLENNSIFVDPAGRQQFNRTANLTLFNTDAWGISDRAPYRDGSVCPPSICTEIADANDYVFNVTGFSNYSVGEDGGGPAPIIVSLNKTLLTPSPEAGSNVMFEVNITNLGTDQLPLGFMLNDTFDRNYAAFNSVNVTPDESETANGWLAWNISGMPAGDALSIGINLTADNPGSTSNNVTLRNQSGEGVAFKSAPFTITSGPPPESLNVSLDKTLLTTSPAVGGMVNFRVNVTNNGQAALTSSMNLTDYFDTAYLQFMSSNRTLNHNLPANGEIGWSVPPLGVGQSFIASADFDAVGSGTTVNNVTLRNQTGSIVATNYSQATIAPPLFNWADFAAFYSGTMDPYASNGPGCYYMNTSGLSQPTTSPISPGDNCPDNNASWDLGAVWIDFTADYIGWQVQGPAVFGDPGAEPNFCNPSSDINNSLYIEFDKDNNASTGCTGSKPCYDGAEFQIILNATGATFNYYNASLESCNDVNSNYCKPGEPEYNPANCTCFQVNSSVDVNRTDCMATYGLRIAVPRSAIEPLTGLNFLVNVISIDGGGPRESLGDQNMDNIMGGAVDDMMYNDQHPCLYYDFTTQAECVGNTDDVTGAEECRWDDFMQICDPDFKNMNCSDFCGACGTAAECLSEGVKGSCMVASAPSPVPPDATTWDSGTKMCVEDPSKFIFGMGGNCDDNCFDCYTEQMCNNSNVPHPTDGAASAGCKWFTDSVFGDSWCDKASFELESCDSDNCGRCFTNAYCDGAGGNCTWDGDLVLCYDNSSEICYNGVDDEGDGDVDCDDTDCKDEIMCGGDINVLTGGYGTTDPLAALQQDMFQGMQGAPIIIGEDAVGEGAADHLDIRGVGVKESDKSLIFGIEVIDFNTRICDGQNEGAYYYLLDTDNNASTGCIVNIDGTDLGGFEYKFIYAVDNVSATINETRLSYKCKDDSSFVLKPVKVTGAPQLPGMTGSPSCAYDTAMIAIDSLGIGNPTGTIRLRVATSTIGGSTSSPSDSIGEDLYYTSGAFDFEPNDCFDNPSACGTGFSIIGGGDFMPFEDCFPGSGDEDLDGMEDCDDTDCYYVPPCDAQVDPSADKEMPKVIMQSVEKFTDFAMLFWTTNRPSNGSVLFSGTNSTCAINTANYTDLTDPDMAELNTGKYVTWHNVPIGSLSSNITYFYKIKSCGQNDLCSISSCLNFTTLETDTDFKIKMTFEPTGPPTDPLGNLTYELNNGSGYVDRTDDMKAGANFNRTFNNSLRFRNPQATLNWSIRFEGVDFTKSKEFNLTGAFNISVNASGRVQVGMDKNKFLDLAQGLGADKVYIHIPQAGTDLMRCDNGQNCQAVDNYTSFDTSDLEGSAWEIPLGLGFSDFNVHGYSFNLQGAPSNVYLTYTNGTNLSTDGCQGNNCAETDANIMQFRQTTTGRRVAEFNITGSVDMGDGGTTEIMYNNVSTVVHRFSNQNKVYPYYDIFVVNLNRGKGVFVCKDAEDLDDLDPIDCGGMGAPIIFGPSDIGTTKEGVTVEFNETDYKIRNLSGSGAGLMYILNFSSDTTYLEMVAQTGENYTIINVTNGEAQPREYNFSLEIQGEDLNYTINGSYPTLDEINFTVDMQIDINISFNDSTAGVRYVSLLAIPTDNDTITLNSSDDMGLITVNVTAGPAAPGGDAPTVTLNSPDDNHNTTSGIITFNCTAYDDLKIDNVTLYHNASGWGANETNTSGFNNTAYIFLGNLSDGSYEWNCYACDNSSNCSFASSNRTLTVDSTAPTWDQALENQIIAFGSAFVYDVNASDTNGIDTYAVNNGNFNIDAANGNITNATALSVGSYDLNVSVNDSFGNILWRVFSVSVRLDVTVLHVEPLEGWVLNDTIKFECSASSAYSLVNATLWHNYSGTWETNGSVSLGGTTDEEFEFNRTGFSSEKTFDWGCEACDANVCNLSVNRTITTDLTLPLIEFVDPTPPNNARNSSLFDWAYINVSTTETNNHSVILDWNRSLIAWWRMEQGNGTLFSDSSTYGKDGTCNETFCPEIRAGARGKSYKFDGVDDYVKIDYDFPDTDLTIASWFKVDAFRIPGAGSIIFDKQYGILNLLVFTSGTSSPGKVRLSIWNGSSVWLTTSSIINPDTWYFAVTTIDTTTNALNLYVDGALKASRVYEGTYISGNYIVTLGANAWGAASHFNGSIDEVMLWNRVLSPEEINASYHAGLQRLERNFTDLPVGTVNYTAYTVDMAGNLNQTEYRNYSVNYVPSLSITEIKSADETNYSDEELTVYYTTFDSDSSDTVKNITTWYINGSGITLLDMPFEAVGGSNESSWAKDYTNFSNHGNVTNATWNSTGGYDGRGAYEFNGLGDYISVIDDDTLSFNETSAFSISLWFNGMSNYTTSEMVE